MEFIKAKKKHIRLFGLTTACALVSSISVNYFIFLSLPENQTWPVWKWLHFTHIRNHGGVFGILQGHSILFSLVSGSLLLALVIYLLRTQQIKRYEYGCFGFILGGGLANISDRLIYGSVIDYFDVRGIPHWHYIFNLADVMIHVGLWSMLFIGFFLSNGKKSSDPAVSSDQASPLDPN